MAYGLTSTGFVAKPLDVIKTEMEDRFRAVFGETVNLDAREPLGQIIGVLAEREASLWELLEDVYRAMDPSANEGDAQDAVCAITGTVRNPARKSAVGVMVTGTPGSRVPAGMVIRTAAGHRFACAAENVIPGGGSVAALFLAEVTGPVPAPAGSLTEIETPASGIDSVTNPLDAELGADIETAAALRKRRENELRVNGGAAVEAIREDVALVAGVIACIVFENTTGTTNGDGVPAKAIEVLVQGGDDQAIRNAIWGSRSAGIETHGGVTGTVTDSQGTVHTVKFTRPTVRNVYLDVDVKVTSAYPSDGDDQVKAALAAKSYTAGADVISWALKKLVGVAGVDDVPSLRVGLAAWPATEATLAVAPRELADLDTSRIRVNHV